MNQITEIRRSESRSSKIASCLLDSIGLKKLFDTLYTANEEACQHALGELNLENAGSAERQEQFRQRVGSAYKLMVSVVGVDGEFFTSEDNSIFDEANLPDKVKTILFSNATYFKFVFNFEPAYKIEVALDFSAPPIVNFKPSEATPNASSAEVTGLNQTWVRGTYERIMSVLKERRKKTGWLHKKGIYDLLLWLGLIPLTFYYLHKFSPQISSLTSGMTTVLAVGFYIYSYVFILIIFMMFFNYSRWLFPYMELKNNINNRALRHRGLFFTLVVGLLGSSLYDLLKYLKSFFK